MKYIYSIFMIIVLVACENDDYPVQFKNEQIIRLLTRDQNKYWTPASSVACQQDDVVIFAVAADDDTPAKFRLKKGIELCPEESEEDIVGTWEILRTGGVDRLVIYTSETITYEILLITSERLHLRNAETEWNLLAI